MYIKSNKFHKQVVLQPRPTLHCNFKVRPWKLNKIHWRNYTYVKEFENMFISAEAKKKELYFLVLLYLCVCVCVCRRAREIKYKQDKSATSKDKITLLIEEKCNARTDQYKWERRLFLIWFLKSAQNSLLLRNIPEIQLHSRHTHISLNMLINSVMYVVVYAYLYFGNPHHA